MPRRRTSTIGLFALCAIAATIAGCGGAATTSNVASVRGSVPSTLSVAELERQLSAGVRDGLGRLAVMQQPRDGAADLGQDLPEGLVERVRCAPSRPAGRSGARSTTCAVTWKTAAGTPQRTDYVVALRAGRCFAARAEPALPVVRDATIESFADHPLGRIYSLVPGC